MSDFPTGTGKILETALTQFFSSRLKPSTRLCVGLSGGRDSVVLLHALSRLASGHPFKLSAVHVHHGISAQADAWADFCADFCQRLGVPLRIVRVDVPRDSGEGLEGAARRMRHAVFSGSDADWICLAHHRDDQAETVLLNLLRGAGVSGVAGMLAERPQRRGAVLVRPLLDVPRAAIEAYAGEFDLRWIDDESNEDLHFRRNFLRHEVLPRLEEKFPGTRKALASAAKHCAEGALLLDELAAIDHAALSGPAGRIALAGFNALSPARARNLLRFAWCGAGFRAPDARWIDEALKQLATTTALSETCLATSDGELHVFRGELHIVGLTPPAPDQAVSWAGEERLPWAGGFVRFVPVMGAGLARALLENGEVSLRPRQGGERLQPHPRRPRRSLRNLLRETGVPPWERVRLPYLWSHDRLLWVGGLGVDSAYACAPDEPGLLPVWEP